MKRPKFILLLLLLVLSVSSSPWAAAPEELIAEAEKAVDLQMRHGRRDGQAIALSHLGQVYFRQGDLVSARFYFEQALKLHQAVHDSRGEAALYDNLGGLETRLGHYGEALCYLRKGLHLFDAARNLPSVAHLLANMGILYWNRSRARAFDSLNPFLDDSCPQVPKPKHEQDCNTDNTEMGTAECLLEAAVEICERDGARNPRVLGGAHSALGAIAVSAEQWQSGMRHQLAALNAFREAGDPWGKATSMLNLAHALYIGGALQEAVSRYRDTIALATESDEHEILWRAHTGLGFALRDLNKLSGAIDAMKIAVDIIEQIREELPLASDSLSESRLDYLYSRREPYEALIDLYLAQDAKSPGNDFDRRAFRVFEHQRGRMLLDQLGEGRAERFFTQAKGLPDEKERLRDELEQTDSDLAGARNQSFQHIDAQKIESFAVDRKALQAKIQALDAKLRRFAAPATETEVIAALAPDEAMLVYSVGGDETTLWLLTEAGLRTHRIQVGERELSKRVGMLRTALQRKDWGTRGTTIRLQSPREVPTGMSLSRALHDLLMPEAVRSTLSDKELAIIVPSGPLQDLPFEILASVGLNDRPRFLIEELAVSYLSSASLLPLTRRNRPLSPDRRESLLAFAVNRYDKLQPLQMAESEAQEVAKKLGLSVDDATRHLYLAEAATPEQVKDLSKANRLADYRYVLFAVHGDLPAQISRHQQPALVLSAPGEDDGRLTMEEVLELRLDADLTVLSACQSGRGEAVRGEGVIGLTRAFMVAGSRAVAVTLWNVDDASSKALSGALFDSLAKGQRDGARALREAKLRMIRGASSGRDFSAPYYWAPLVLFGDPALGAGAHKSSL